MTTPLTIADAHAVAARWVTHNQQIHEAAFIGGSAATATSETPYDPASDVDCYLVISEPAPEGKIGKIRINGVLLDVSWMTWPQIESARANAVTASLLNFGAIIADPSRRLQSNQDEIRRSFVDPASIALRLEDMRQRIRTGLVADSSHLPPPEQLMNWLFPATLATHIPLVASCAPLTVRKRFVAAKHVMEPADYESLLALYGFTDVTVPRVQQWLMLTERIFTENAVLAETSVRFWAGDIHEDARPIAIGGSQQLIDMGLHREAIYWILATCSRCLVVRSDAEEAPSAYTDAYEAMLTALNIRTPDQRSTKTNRILEWI